MNFTTILGLIAIVAGVVILIWPVLLNVIVALALIVGGVVAVYAGATRARVA